jgi:NADH-quinone oxidoreductase subunit M
VAGPLLLEARAMRRRSIASARWRRALVVAGTRHRPAAVGLPLHLRLRDADRRQRGRHLDHVAVNQLGFPILTLMLLVPTLAAVACLFVNANSARLVALAATLIDLLLGILLWATYEVGGEQWQFIEYLDLFGRFGWALGIDGIALMLIMLSVFLMPICILASQSITNRVQEYMASFLMVEVLMLGVFMAQDIFLFYIFFEAGLIPMYLIIGIWGGANRIYAAYKFFLYTLLGSC